ncbi:MAG: aminotransferase class V-fold PLP-dependent enzyme [Clostridia bacterium]|nr:aminotransferase class V-fold PLP-dependent enzyme [Clostridia bacterium]
MINFTVGPVQSTEEVKEIGAKSAPYFRTPEFSEKMFENEKLMCEFANAPEGARAVFITGSGTASMEAAVINTLDRNDNVIVVNGGGFGQRFADICALHEIPLTEIKLEVGKTLTKEDLENLPDKKYTALLVNIHETSTGVHYDPDLIGDFCKENGIFLIVDAISSFLADDFDMEKCGADIMITGSQKALACPPGVSVMVLSKKAQQRIATHNSGCMYFDLKSALSNGERGQTPFTPAVSTLLQINARLKKIKANGGRKSETEKIAAIAQDFRNKIKGMPFEIVSNSLSNAVTPLRPRNNVSAYDIFTVLKDEYEIWVCPNGGDLKEKVFRVGHIGALEISDNDKLIAALKDMQKRNLI